MKQQLLKKFLCFSYGTWVGTVVGLMSTVITTRILSPGDFGKASLFNLALNISMAITVFGTDQAYVRFFYEEKEENRGALLYNCLGMSMVLGFTLCSLIFFFSRSITGLLFQEKNLIVGRMLAVGVLAQTVLRYGTLVVRMQQKGNVFSVLEILNRSLNLVFVVFFYYLIRSGYEIIVYSTVVTVVAVSTVAVVLEKRHWSLDNLFRSGLTHSKIEIIKYAYPLGLTMLITWLFQSFDKIAIRYWSSLNELGVYAAAFRIVGLVTVIQTNFSSFWIPVCYKAFEENPEDRAFYQKAATVVSFAMFLVAFASIAGKDVAILLLGEDYREAANVMVFLVFMPVLYTISETTVIGINFLKKAKWHIAIAGVSCLINIIGNWILVPRYGAVGASVATAFSYFVFFSLRTYISLLYYKVDYGLKKLHLVLAVLFAYALFSVIESSLKLKVLIGFTVLTAILLTYSRDLVQVVGIRLRKWGSTS